RLSYSWLVHPDGTILQGQDGHVGAHTRGQNSTSEAICCIGNFEKDQPTEEMCAAISMILALRDRPLLGGHRDAPGAATACPGRNLQSAIPGLRENAERWEGWHNKPSWVSDSAWRDLHAFARNGANFPTP
ncbi:MAG TPA: peptidoglycan recognition family protein, partial [Acidimicrobiia bacterium]